VAGGKSGAYESPSAGGQTPSGGGSYTSPGTPGANPYMDSMFGRAADGVNAQMRNTQTGMGMSNAGVNEASNRGMNDLATQFYGGAYNNEANRVLQMRGMDQNFYTNSANRQAGMREGDQNRQMQAIMAMPGYASSLTQYGLGMGDVERNSNQQLINANIGQWNQAQQHPLSSLDIRGQALGIGSGMGGTMVSQNNPGTFAGPTSTAGMLGGYGYDYGGVPS
jgi:hypothetical protein